VCCCCLNSFTNVAYADWCSISFFLFFLIACKKDIEFVKDAFRSVFHMDCSERERRIINKQFYHIFLLEKVRLHQDWFFVFAAFVSTKSNGHLRLEITNKKVDVVLKYKTEAYFKITDSEHGSCTSLILCPEWKKPFFTDDRVVSVPHPTQQQQQKKKTVDELVDQANAKNSSWKCSMM
jgi:hypothetical protein